MSDDSLEAFLCILGERFCFSVAAILWFSVATCGIIVEGVFQWFANAVRLFCGGLALAMRRWLEVTGIGTHFDLMTAVFWYV